MNVNDLYGKVMEIYLVDAASMNDRVSDVGNGFDSGGILLVTSGCELFGGVIWSENIGLCDEIAELDESEGRRIVNKTWTVGGAY